MTSSILDVITHYQRSIEKSTHDEARLLHCIEKLYKLPVTVEHLQTTGVGKTVNSLRKYKEEVGIAAKALVAKWKAMVAAEEFEAVESDNNDSYQNSSHYNNGNGDDDAENGNQNYIPLQRSSSTAPQSSITSSSSKNDDKRSNHLLKSSHKLENHERERKRDKKNKHNNSSNNCDKNYKHHRKYKESVDLNSSISKKSSHNHRSSSHSSRSSNMSDSNNKKYTNDVNLNGFKENLNEIGFLKLEDNRIKEEIKNEIKQEIENDYPSSNEYDDEESEKLIIDVKIKSEDEDDEEEEENCMQENKNDEQEVKSSKNSKSKLDKKSHSRSKEKHDKKSSHRSNSDHRDKKKSRENEKKKSSSHHKSGSEKEKSSEREKKDSKAGKKDKSSSKNSFEHSSHLNKDKRKNDDCIDSTTSSKKAKVTSKSSLNNGIDNSMGTSFEEALGFLSGGIVSPPSKNTNKSKTSSNNSNEEKDNFVKPLNRAISSTFSSSNIKNVSTPDLLSSSINLKPLDPNIALELPTISPNYKPMPLNPTVMECVFNSNRPQRRTMSDEEAIAAGISSKTIRTKVYSGVKTGQTHQVPSLFDLCIWVLQKNIDALEYTGGVPFDVLKAVLEIASPLQLANIEEYNPYLMEDTDILWEKICVRQCKGVKRQEMETWREMYMRCQEEREERLSKLTENIKQSQKIITQPVRKTQLAYVDSMVKPPRSVQRKQEQFGTSHKKVTTPAARVASLSNVAPNIAKAPVRINPGERDTAHASAHNRPRKAPLMQKTLQLMKGRFKR